MKLKIFKNLNFRLSVTIMLITSVISILFMAFSSYQVNLRFTADYHQNKLNLVKLLNRSLVNSGLQNKNSESAVILENFKVDKDFRFAALYSSDDTLITSFVQSKQVIPRRYTEDFEREAYLVIEEKLISDQEAYFGRLVVGFDKAALQTDIVQSNYKLAALFLLLTLALFVGIKFVLKRTILKPLKYLNELTKSLSSGNFNVQISTSGDDEIGQLAGSFNKMSGHLQSYFDSLINSKKEIEKLENFYNTIINHSPNSIFIINSANQVIISNEAARNCFNLADNHNQPTLTEIHPGFAKSLVAMEPVLQGRQESVSINNETFVINGKDTVFKIIAYTLPKNDFATIVLLIVDVTEQFSLQEQLSQAQKMEAIGTLAGGIAHDFNNVLSGIVGTMSLIKFKFTGKEQINWSDLSYYTEIIDRSADRARDMVQQILNLSRKQETVFQNLNLNDVIKHLKHFCSNSFDKSIELNFEPYPQEAHSFADYTKIEQVLLNLCLNAAHAMTIMKESNQPQGGVLSVSIKKIYSDDFFKAVHPEADSIEYWLIKVSDNGVGIAKSSLQKIFEPFFTTKNKDQGTGLGLSMVYNTVRAHNGLIRVYSELGTGTAFHIYLPVSHDLEITETADRVNRIYKGMGTVLVVDDEKVMRDLARDILEACGYEVVTAENGEDAVNLFREKYHLFRMVVLDLIMPKKSGRETFDEMKIIQPDAKILMSSGFIQDDRIAHLLEHGANGFLEKPYTLQTLSKAVYDILK